MIRFKVFGIPGPSQEEPFEPVEVWWHHGRWWHWIWYAFRNCSNPEINRNQMKCNEKYLGYLFLGYYRGWPDSSGCFFSWVFLIFDWPMIYYPGPMKTQALIAPKQADWLKTNHTIGLAFSLAQGGPSQIWEILKRKSSHLNLVTLDNTIFAQLYSNNRDFLT